eukprot:SM000168S02611  [mRNA]  locus=s168:147428:150044:- [translate_table: standard]
MSSLRGALGPLPCRRQGVGGPSAGLHHSVQRRLNRGLAGWSCRQLPPPSLAPRAKSQANSGSQQYSDEGMMPQLELQRGSPKLRRGGGPGGASSRPMQSSFNGVFVLLLLNLALFLGDHILKIPALRLLYLYHNNPRWYQFITATFCHMDWKHLSSNLFFIYVFGKLVEEEEGSFGVLASYLMTGVGANLVSWLLLPGNNVSVGASGAVFGLFAVSVLVKISWNWRKLLEVLILGQFVVLSEASATAAFSGSAMGPQAGSINHIAHLSGALLGVGLIWLVSRLPSSVSDRKELKAPRE